MTQIWAHRGASAYAPENTLPAFELAVAQGAEGVEFDVQLSSDGILVVIHDETLDRTTNGTGQVGDHTLAQLQALDASAGRTEFAGVRIPTLAEVLELVAPTRMRINIELKNSIVDYPGLEQKVLGHVRAFDLSKRVVLSTFNHFSLRRLQSLKPVCPLGVLYSDPMVRPWRYAKDLGIDAIHPPFPYVPDKKFVKKAHKAGVAVRPWVADAEKDLHRAFRWGVDAIFTDVPDVALAVRAQG